nr:MAG TPA: hypothetical protein [Caudoviricetes sp.]
MSRDLINFFKRKIKFIFLLNDFLLCLGRKNKT